MNELPFQPSRRVALRTLGGLACGISLIPIVGCSKLLLGGGKILFGDPKITSEFTKLTLEDLAKGAKTVLVVCSTPESVDAEYSSLKSDLIDGVTRRMKFNHVKIVNPDRVVDWLENHGGGSPDFQALAKDFDTDFIALIDIQTYALREPNTPKMLRGSSSGFIRVSRIEEVDGKRHAIMAYTREFSLTFPQHQPLSENGRSSVVFQKQYVSELCDMLAQRFYNHRPGTNF
jgi:hypothetical protein